MNIEDFANKPIGLDVPITSEDWAHARIATWPHDDWAGLFDFIDHEWDHIYGKIEEDDENYRFITGGWSYNEAILSALRENKMIQVFYWQSSHRGGLEVYSKKP